MADKRTAEKFQKVKDQLEAVRAERDGARQDLADIKNTLAAMLALPDVGPEELAAGMALVSSIMAVPPGAYTPDVSTLAALAHVPKSSVLVAIDAFQEAGILYAANT